MQNIRTEEAQAVLKLKKEKHPLEAERLQKERITIWNLWKKPVGAMA